MGSIRVLAEEVERGLRQLHPGLRKTVVRKLAPLVATVIQAQTANTAMWAALLPIETERIDMRMQWIARLLANRLVDCQRIMEPFARHQLEVAAKNCQVVVLSMDQTDLGNRFAILMISVRVGDRALPLIWEVEAGAANLGFEAQRRLLEIVAEWLPPGTKVLLAGDRFYPSEELFRWLNGHGWGYRLRLKGNLALDVGKPDVTVTGDLAKGATARFEADARLFQSGIETNIGTWHEPGHDEPWIIAMECPPTAAAVRDYGLRWGIEPMFSDFKSRGFGLEETQLQHADRVARLVLVMTLAMYWCTEVGRCDARDAPTPLEKKPPSRLTPTIGDSANKPARYSPGSNAG